MSTPESAVTTNGSGGGSPKRSTMSAASRKKKQAYNRAWYKKNRKKVLARTRQLRAKEGSRRSRKGRVAHATASERSRAAHVTRRTRSLDAIIYLEKAQALLGRNPRLGNALIVLAIGALKGEV